MIQLAPRFYSALGQKYLLLLFLDSLQKENAILRMNVSMQSMLPRKTHLGPQVF